MPRLCAFCGCNNRVGCGLSFFAFPKDDTSSVPLGDSSLKPLGSHLGNVCRRRKWLLNLMRADLSPDMTREESDRAAYVVCEQHFRPKDINSKDTPGDPQRGEEEKLADVAGWVVQKVAQHPEVSTCTECESLLVETNDTEHNYHTRVEEDAVSAAKKSPTSARLLHPSEAFRECISKCDGVVQKIPPNATAPKKLKAYLRASGAFSELHRIHPTHSKAIERVALNKYVMCRVVAELKETAQSRKRTHEKKRAKC